MRLRGARCIEFSNGEFASRQCAPFIAVKREQLTSLVGEDSCELVGPSGFDCRKAITLSGIGADGPMRLQQPITSAAFLRSIPSDS